MAGFIFESINLFEISMHTNNMAVCCQNKKNRLFFCLLARKTFSEVFFDWEIYQTAANNLNIVISKAFFVYNKASLLCILLFFFVLIKNCHLLRCAPRHLCMSVLARKAERKKVMHLEQSCAVICRGKVFHSIHFV